MGVDWIPCRIEHGVDEEVVAKAAKLEAKRFCADGGRLWYELWHFAGKDPFDEKDRERIHNNLADEEGVHPFQSIADLLLLKNKSFRVNVVGDLKILPLEWRKAAYRTILPCELPAQFRQWATFRDEVGAGSHRDYLADVLVYCCEVDLGCYQLEKAGDVKRSEETAAAWAQRPESIAARDNWMVFPAPKTPVPPEWTPGYVGEESTRRDRLANLMARRQQLFKLARDWNEAIRRGNWKIADPPKSLKSRIGLESN